MQNLIQSLMQNLIQNLIQWTNVGHNVKTRYRKKNTEELCRV